MFTLLFIAMCFSMVVAFFLIRQLQEKPWTQHGVLEGSQDGLTSSAPKVGLWVFLGVVTSVFLVFIGAYFMRVDTSHGGVSSGMMLWAAQLRAWLTVISKKSSQASDSRCFIFLLASVSSGISATSF